ncbi:hypothetical protein AVEN_178030-1 [Araneus ventricosus]|uniref:Uncharacterized protein n=1 Tax=Araneus ventricosus TaxID=182803 RepID=A0A4Y2I3K6_ARAVE|nr:hypothetical protein AVEN_178030-1 [Araneus ventricosus]
MWCISRWHLATEGILISLNSVVSAISILSGKVIDMEVVALRGSRSLNLAAVARSLATSLLRPIEGHYLEGIEPRGACELRSRPDTEKEGQSFWGKKERGGISPALHGSCFGCSTSR